MSRWSQSFRDNRCIYYHASIAIIVKYRQVYYQVLPSIHKYSAKHRQVLSNIQKYSEALPSIIAKYCQLFRTRGARTVKSILDALLVLDEANVLVIRENADAVCDIGIHVQQPESASFVV